MDDIKFKQSTTIAKQILLQFVDYSRILVYPFFDTTKMYRTALENYDHFRITDKEKFRKELYRLKQKGFINRYYIEKKPYISLTNKGKKIINKYLLEDLEVTYPSKWDKKWHLVVFDIPNQKKKCRDLIRNKLEQIGFIKLQESIYIFPFNCLNEVNFLKNNYFVSPYIQYIIADRVETETNLIKKFLDLGILKNNMLK